MRVETKNEKETMEFAKDFAKQVKSPCVIILKGELGAGKTHFVKGFVQGKKIKSLVTSPTFTIMNIYESKKQKIYHFDMYRLSSSEEAEELGFYEYFDHDSLDGIAIVEWPENVPELVKNYDIVVSIQKEDQDKRIIEVNRRK